MAIGHQVLMGEVLQQLNLNQHLFQPSMVISYRYSFACEVT